MNTELLGELRAELNDFEATAPFERRKLEAKMQVLATTIFLLMDSPGDEPSSLADALELLPIREEERQNLAGISSEIQEALDMADYESGDDEEIEETIEGLKNDFYGDFDIVLRKLLESNQ